MTTMLRRMIHIARKPMVLVAHRRLAHRARDLVVSFAFDDIRRSAASNGARILAAHHAAGTYYVSLCKMAKRVNKGERFDAEDLRRLAADGHEIASHTFHHRSSERVSLAEFHADALRGREAIGELGITPSDNFAYPFGEVTLAAKQILAREMSTCRGMVPGVNGQVVDLALLRANRLYGGVERLDRVRHLLRYARWRGGWLIFYTHDVRDDPSPRGCTPALLEGAVALALAEGARIATVADVAGTCRSPT